MGHSTEKKKRKRPWFIYQNLNESKAFLNKLVGESAYTKIVLHCFLSIKLQCQCRSLKTFVTYIVNSAVIRLMLF